MPDERPARTVRAAALVAVAGAGALVAVVLAASGSGADGGAGAGPAPTRAPAATARAPAEPLVRDISSPGRLTRWAYVSRPVAVRAVPRRSGRIVGRLRLRTGDGTSELVMALQRTREPTGRPWVRVRTPLLPTGTTGWVPRSALGAYQHVTTWLLVDRARRRLALVRDGHIVLRAPIGIGRRGSPTPAGRFYVRSRLLDLDPSGAYGPAAFGTSARSTTVTDWPGERVVGIHGTNRPELLPGRVSHGCIRMRNADIRRLVRLMPVGTPVTVV